MNAGVEELLEHLYVRETEAQPLDPARYPTESVEDACLAGHVERRDGDIRLTGSGLAAGRDMLRRHRLAESLLHDVLEVRSDDLDEDACEFEHVLRHGLDEKICALLGHPSMCPHGHPIPEGECCRRAKVDRIREVGPLCDGQVGQDGLVAYLNTRDNKEIQKLMAMGVLPGARIRLVRRFPSYVFELGYSQFTVDRHLAEKIHVHWGRTHPGGG